MCCFRLITFMKGLTKFLSEPCDIIMFHFIIINTSPLSSIQTLGTIPFREKNNFMKSDQGHIPGYPPHALQLLGWIPPFRAKVIYKVSP